MMGQGFRVRERSVLHFNVADFAVAVEQVTDVSLRGRPLLIAPLQAARAVVYDMSEEAYREGVRKGMPLKAGDQDLPRCGGPAAPGWVCTRRRWRAFFKELQGYSPLIECGRADGHFFVDVTGTHRLHGLPPISAGGCAARPAPSLGINPIWTLGTSKLVAKVASRLVKPVGEYIVTPGEEEAFLAPLPVTVLPGLTGRELEKLRDFRLTTIGALAGLSRHQLMVPFGSRCEYLHDISRGIDDTPGQPAGRGERDSSTSKQIFADDSNDQREVERVVAALVGRAGAVCAADSRWPGGSGSGCGTRTAAMWSARPPAGAAPPAIFSSANWPWTPCSGPGRRRTRIRSCRLVCDRLQRQSPQLLALSRTAGPGASGQEGAGRHGHLAQPFWPRGDRDRR